jgi:hypothetical protein
MSENGHGRKLLDRLTWPEDLSDVPDGARFGDSPDFVRNHTWFPLKKIHLRISPEEIRKIESGEVKLAVQTLSVQWQQVRGMFWQPSFTPLSKHLLSKSQASDNRLIILKASGEAPLAHFDSFDHDPQHWGWFDKPWGNFVDHGPQHFDWF